MRPARPAGVKISREQIGQLLPLPVVAGAADGHGQALQTPERGQLQLQLVDGARRGGLVQHLLLDRLHLLVGRLVQVLEVLGVQQRSVGHQHRRHRAPPQQLQLPQPLLQPLATTAQGLVDGLR